MKRCLAVLIVILLLFCSCSKEQNTIPRVENEPESQSEESLQTSEAEAPLDSPPLPRKSAVSAEPAMVFDGEIKELNLHDFVTSKLPPLDSRWFFQNDTHLYLFFQVGGEADYLSAHAVGLWKRRRYQMSHAPRNIVFGIRGVTVLTDGYS